MGIEIRDYKPEDYVTIQRRYFDSLTFLNFPDPKLMAKELAKGRAFTIFNNGEIVACGGIMPFWKGVGEAWTVTSPLVSQYPLFFAKNVWRKLRDLIKSMNLERVQTFVDAENVISQRWVERMNFKNEGLMRKYLGGRDFIRYGLIKEK